MVCRLLRARLEEESRAHAAALAAERQKAARVEKEERERSAAA